MIEESYILLVILFTWFVCISKYEVKANMLCLEYHLYYT